MADGRGRRSSQYLTCPAPRSFENQIFQEGMKYIEY
jgi:hypothetical protein